jgi:hypothetical protein
MYDEMADVIHQRKWQASDYMTPQKPLKVHCDGLLGVKIPLTITGTTTPAPL